MRTVKPPDERRQELLDIGIDLFLAQGSAGVSIQNVISRANVATGLFYYYFPSKEAFIEEAVTRYVTDFSARLAEMLEQHDESAPVSIKRAMDSFLVHAQASLPIMRDSVVNTPQFHIVMHGILESLCPTIESLIEKGVAGGDFHVLSPEITARFILNGLVGILHIGASDLPKWDTQKEIKRIVFAALGVDGI